MVAADESATTISHSKRIYWYDELHDGRLGIPQHIWSSSCWQESR